MPGRCLNIPVAAFRCGPPTGGLAFLNSPFVGIPLGSRPAWLNAPPFPALPAVHDDVFVTGRPLCDDVPRLAVLIGWPTFCAGGAFPR